MAEKKAAKPQEESAAAPLGDAGASADPLVHQQLAHRQTAVSNGDEDAVRAADEALAALGVAV